MEGKGQYVLTARTTIDLTMQQAAEEALNRQSASTARPRLRSGALVSMEPDGAVRALVGGLDYGESQFNRATHARRQPGSSFKLYVYVAALENGYTAKSIVRDSSGTLRQLAAEELRRRQRAGPRDSFGDAFKVSLNTTAVELSLEGRPRQGHRDDAAARRRRRQEDVLDGAGRYRHHADGAHRRASQHSPTAASSPSPMRCSRHSTPRARSSTRASATSRGRADDQAARRRADEPDDAAVVTEGTGKRRARFHPCRRQDRHQLQLSRCLVRGHHRLARHRRVARQRRLYRS